MTRERWLRLLLPAFFPPLIMAGILIYSSLTESSLVGWGILPLHPESLLGILLAPLAHEGFEHLFSNIIPFFFMTLLLFYFYDEVAWRVFIWSWFFPGVMVWLGARENWHIGASGVVYSLAAFHVVSGILRRNPRLLAISLLMVFLYGGMIWGIFPNFFPGKNVSWESHLSGLITGTILAVYYRSKGLQAPVYSWDLENEEEENTEPNKEYLAEQAKETMVRYIFKEKNEGNNPENPI